MFKILFSCILISTCLANIKNIDPTKSIFGAHSPLEDLIIKPGKNVHKDHQQIQDVQDNHVGPETLTMRFVAYESIFELNLRLDLELFASHLPNKRYWTYRGNVLVNDWIEGKATLTFLGNNINAKWIGSVYLNNKKYNFQSSSHVAQFKDSEYKMVLSLNGKHDDVIGDLKKPITTDGEIFERRRLNLDYWANCWPDQDKFILKVSVGYTLDVGLINRLDTYLSEVEVSSKRDKMMVWLAQMNADTNQIYHSQLDIYWEIGEVYMQGIDSGIPSGLPLAACPGSIDSYLDSLADWRRTHKKDTMSLWKSLTTCFDPPGTVGLAYVGTLCYDLAVGITNFMYENNGGTWAVNAHEGGHIFGADHSFENGQGSTGGIMDYGDGFFQEVYSFNRLRFNEVCGVLTNGMSRKPGCFSVFGKDVSGSDDVFSVSNGFGYSWRKDASFTACSPPKGRYTFKSIVYVCEQTETSTGRRSPSLTSNCNTATKPHGELYECSAQTNYGTCGDGKIADGEHCDPSISGSCCDLTTCKWLNEVNAVEIDCTGASNHVDAAFRAHNGKLYLLSGDQVFRYSNGGQSGGLDSGYPKLIQTEWTGVPDAFATEIGGIVILQGLNEIYMFKGKNYIQINYDNGSLKQGSTQLTADQTSDESSSSTVKFDDDVPWTSIYSENTRLFDKCGTVTAALSMPNSFLLFCETFYIEMDYNFNFQELRPEYELNLQWDTSTLWTFVGAAYYDKSTGLSRFYNGGYFVDWKGYRVEANPSINFPLTYTGATSSGGSGSEDGSDASTCASHCTSCFPGQPDNCLSCEDGYRLFNNICIDAAISVYIGWNVGDEDYDHMFLKEGKAQLEGYITSGRVVDGSVNHDYESGNNVYVMRTTDKIDFAPLNQQFDDFEIKTHFKPTGSLDATRRLFTFTDGVEQRIKISLTAAQADRTDLLIEFRSHFLLCQVEKPLAVDTATTISVRFKQSEIRCCVGGVCHTRAYSVSTDDGGAVDSVGSGTTFSASDLHFTISDWHMGDSIAGPEGIVDDIELTVFGLPLDDGRPKGFLLFVFVCFLLINTIGVMMWKNRISLCDPCTADRGSSRKQKKKPIVVNEAPPPPPTKKTFGIQSQQKVPPPAPKKNNGFGGKKNVGPPSPPLAKRTSATLTGAPPPPYAAVTGGSSLPTKAGKLNMNKFGNVAGKNKGGRLPPPPQKKNLW